MKRSPKTKSVKRLLAEARMWTAIPQRVFALEALIRAVEQLAIKNKML